MSDNVPKSKPKAVPGPAPAPESAPALEAPKVEAAAADTLKFDFAAAFRELTEKTTAQAKNGYETFKAAADEASDVVEDTFASATRGATAYGLKLIEHARANSDATFAHAAELMGAKTLSEVIALSAAHGRRQFEALLSQSKELTAIAQTIAVDTSEPVKDSISKAFSRAA